MLIFLLLAALGTTPTTDKPTPIEWNIPEGATNIAIEGKEITIKGFDGPSTTQIINLSPANAPSHHYMLTGRIKYEGIDGAGYFEMWSYFKDGGMFFSRTLAPGGPMGQMTGTSHWRDLQLPFFSKPGYLPERITLAVVLPGKGKVWVEPLTLSAVPATSGSSSGMIAATAGSLVGIWGAVFGITAAFRSTRRWSIAVAVIGILLGVVLLAQAAFAWSQQASVDQWIPFLAIGILQLLLGALFIPVIRAVIAKDEMQTMRALDAELG